MFSYITGESNKIGFGMLPGVADFPSAHLKRRCLIVHGDKILNNTGNSAVKTATVYFPPTAQCFLSLVKNY